MIRVFRDRRPLSHRIQIENLRSTVTVRFKHV